MALELAKTYKEVTGLDPMEGMVKAGLQPADKRIRYAVGNAEDLSAAGIEDASIDLVVAGEAAHYFDHAKSWSEVGRVLRPKGTVAWVVSNDVGGAVVGLPLQPLVMTALHLGDSADAQGYGRISFPGHERANTVINKLMDVTLASYWSEPGWSISEGLYDRIPFPVLPAPNTLAQSLPDLEGPGHPRNSTIAEPLPVGKGEGWDPASALRLKSGDCGEWRLKERWTLHQLEKCLRSWSSVKRFQDKKGEDVVAEVMEQLGPILGDEFDVAWPLVIMLIRRK